MRLSYYTILFCGVLLSACNKPTSASDSVKGGIVEEPSGEAAPPPAPITEVPAETYFKSLSLGESALLGESTGDLDKDGIPEKVLVVDEEGNEQAPDTKRELHILKKDGGEWKLWHKSQGAVLSSGSGGMLGDPFQKVEINNGALRIHHYGGSRDRWGYRHTYRYQNGRWEMIGADIIYYDAFCMDSRRFDYNASTGKGVYLAESYDCEQEPPAPGKKTNKTFRLEMSPLPLMDGFAPGENKAEVDGIKETFWY